MHNPIIKYILMSTGLDYVTLLTKLIVDRSDIRLADKARFNSTFPFRASNERIVITLKIPAL
jgi:hypothetical protein